MGSEADFIHGPLEKGRALQQRLPCHAIELRLLKRRHLLGPRERHELRPSLAKDTRHGSIASMRILLIDFAPRYAITQFPTRSIDSRH